MKMRHFSISNFYCTKCGNQGIPISRKNGSRRGYQHLKKLYCIYCKEEVNHIEVRDIDNKEDVIKNLLKN